MKSFLKTLVILTVIFFVSPEARGQVQDGFYIAPGILGNFQIGGQNRDLEPGPGFQVDGGYRWSKVAWRAKFLISYHNDDNIPFGGVDKEVEFVHFGTDLLLYPLEFTGMAGGAFQPYIFGGFGPYFLTEGSIKTDDDNATGMGGNVGFGIDFRVAEAISVGLENNFHFIGLIEDTNRNTLFSFEDNNGFSAFFYSLALRVGFHF